jgi:ribosome-binding protein aMBF1 (putative translation factor)
MIDRQHADGTDAAEWFGRLLRRDAAVRTEYDRLGPRYAVISELLRARKREGLTQAALGARMGVSQSVVARLESGEHSPRVDTVAQAAAAMGYEIEVRLVKRRARRAAAEESVAYDGA